MAKQLTKAKPPQADEKLTKNFSLSEFTRSRTADALGIANTPSADAIQTIRWVAENVAQPIRDAIGASLSINSGYRSQRVNSATGGVDDSYHLYTDGRWAFDCVAPSLSLFKLLELIESLNLPLTKAILELDQGVVHLQGIRQEYLVREVIGGKKVYTFYKDYKRTKNV